MAKVKLLLTWRMDAIVEHESVELPDDWDSMRYEQKLAWAADKFGAPENDYFDRPDLVQLDEEPDEPAETDEILRKLNDAYKSLKDYGSDPDLLLKVEHAINARKKELGRG